MGMTPLARYLSDQGHRVCGWDDFISEERKQRLSFIHWQNTVPSDCDGCVCSSAIDPKHPLRVAAQRVCSVYLRGEFVAKLLYSQRLCAISGSHGKSTTIAYLIHFFHRYHLPLNYLSGAEFQADAYAVGCGKYKDAWTVLELDESDGTIEAFSPAVSVILNTDWDHPRHYPTKESYQKMFAALAVRTKECVISKEVFQPSPIQQQLTIPEAKTLLEENISAASVAFHYLTGKTVTKNDIQSFPGVKRRQEVLLRTQRFTVVSDYAHHPSELQALWQHLEIDKNHVSVVFEPHRASRLKCFLDGFVQALKRCSQVYVHPLYEAFEAADCNEKSLLAALPNGRPFGQLKVSDWVLVERPCMLAFVGAGKIDAYARRWVEQWIHAVVSFFSSRGLEVKTQVPLQNRSMMGIGGSALFAYEPKEVRDLQKLLKGCSQVGLNVYVLGSGSNVLIPETRWDGMVIFLRLPFWSQCEFLREEEIDPIEKDNSGVADAFEKEGIGDPQFGLLRYVRVGAGMPLPAFLERMETEGMSGFGFLEGIPGTMGGALVMNAGTGTNGICDCVQQVTWMDQDGNLHEISHKNLRYGYRSCETLREGIVLSAILKGRNSTKARVQQERIEVCKKRDCTQPKGKSLGCFFKNPENASAGKCIEESGLKGARVGDAVVSTQHANFLMNVGSAQFTDVVQLVQHIRATVHKKMGIWLEPEVRVLGSSWGEILL